MFKLGHSGMEVTSVTTHACSNGFPIAVGSEVLTGQVYQGVELVPGVRMIHNRGSCWLIGIWLWCYGGVVPGHKVLVLWGGPAP